MQQAPLSSPVAGSFPGETRQPLSPEDLFRLVAENAFDLVAEVDVRGRYCYVSPNHEQVLGYRVEELLGTRPATRVHPDDWTRIGKRWSQMVAAREGRADFRFRHKNGEWLWFEATGRAVLDAEGLPRFLFVCREITERKRHEDELAALVAVGKAINFQLDTAEQVAQLASHLSPFLPFDEFFVSVLEGETLRHVRPGTPDSPPEDWYQPAGPETPIGQALQHGSIVMENHAPIYNPRRPVRSYINVPLLSGSHPLGVLHLDSYEEGVWRDHHVRLAGLVGEQVATSLWRSSLLSESKRQEAALAEANAILRATQEAAVDGICLVDDGGRVVSYNRRFAQLWGLDEELESKLMSEGTVLAHVLAQHSDPDEFLDRISYLFDNPDASARDEIRLVDGRVFERYSAPALAPAQGDTPPRSYGRIWSFIDISERKGYEEKLTHQAFHDAVTGLPNRVLFVDRLGRALARTSRNMRMVAVLFLDLDRFKVVNDSLGHEKGDQLLIEVATRMAHCLRPGDTAARFGGDEFVVLLEDVSSPQDAIRIAERIAQGLNAPMCLDGHEVHVTASIGIVLSASPLESPEELLRKADVAMYKAKNKGRAAYEVFTEEFSEQALERLQLEMELAVVTKREQLQLHYQPLVNMASGRVEAFEALLRWAHPTRGIISPHQFIPIAEETGHIVRIGTWVLEQACQQGAAWRDYRGECPIMHVNLSARQFEQVNLPEIVSNVLERTGFPAQKLMIEITESAIMTDARSATGQLEKLKALGVGIAIDDFGTGYSSLSYLEFFPIDCLKIDRSFTARLAEGTALVRAVAVLGQAIGVEVAAEGIETPEQFEQLKALDVQWAQGYLISRPVPPEQCPALLEEFAGCS